MSTAALILALWPLAPSAPQDPSPPDAEAAVETRTFSLPDTRLVQALHHSAEGHIAARRWSEALADLQRILEDHAGDLLAGERPRNSLGHVSDQPVHPGAAHRVRERLFELPAEARALYVERHGAEAEAALGAARARGDSAALAAIARRWPLTPAAERAWWCLGDLEHEAGRPEQATWAWSRAAAARLADPRVAPRDAAGWSAARAALAERGVLDAGLASRVDRALATARADARPVTTSAGLRLPGGAEASGPPPGPDNDAWPAPYRLPWHPLLTTPRGDGLFGARNGDRLYVSTGLRVLSLSAFGGELVWDSGEPPGWAGLSDIDRSDRFEGVDPQAALLAPAATDDVVVAALQVPFMGVRIEDFQRIRITTPIPDRRLFAFDARTGRKLWDHAPPPGWDGESGDLARRMSCAGAPVISGRRVVVPMVRMQGRIDLHVACFDLDTGALAWSTALISGQRELNMFGRAEREFCAPPVRVEGDRLIVATQLGAIAALDLFSGEILWETLYEQIPLPRTREFRATERKRYWRNCPPVVSDGVVIAVPYDSKHLVVLDLETGAQAWYRDAAWIHRQINAPSDSVDVLLGAEGRTIYLGGDRVVALEAPGGLRSQQRLRVRWSWPNDDVARYRIGRPVLCADRVLVPYDTERVELSLEDGRAIATIAWPGGDGGGNLLVAPGELYTVSTSQVRGVFEWEALLARARAQLAEAPRDATRTLALARLLQGRAGADWGRGLGDAARARWAEARTVLERGLAQGASESRTVLEAELALALRGEARVRAQLADAAGALTLLRRAKPLAQSTTELCDTLREEIGILRERRAPERGELFAALDELARACEGETLRVALSDLRDSAATGLRPRLVPVGPEAADGAVEIPVPLWVLLERATVNAEIGDVAAEFADLHAILALHADVALPLETAGDAASERILALLAAGRRDGYEAFEARARAALDAARAGRDGAALARLARQFPGSAASREANDALLALALERGDLAGLARILDAELPENADASRAGPRETHLLLHLAAAAGRSGNRELSAHLLRALAAAQPDHTPGVPGLPAAPLAQTAAALPAFEVWPGTSEVGRFGTDFTERYEFRGEFEVLGLALPDTALGETPAGAPRGIVVLQTVRELQARSAVVRMLGSDDPGQPRWSRELPAGTLPRTVGPSPWLRRAAFAPGRVLLALRDELIALDAATGEIAWRLRPESDVESMTVACASGVAVVGLIPAGAERPVTLAFDARGGALLWQATLQEAGLQRAPHVADRHVVHLPASGQVRGLVRDLFTGRVLASLQLPTPAVGAVDLEAWTERGLLIVPWFNEMRLSERNHVVAFDLASGAQVWRVPFETLGSRRMLTGAVQQGERTWLRIGAPPRDEDPLPPPFLAELSPGLGAVAPLDAARLASEDVILGLARDTRVRLPEGPLLVLSPRGTRDGSPREARLRAIDPERGELWVQALGLSFDDVRNGGLVQAAWSDRAVVVAIPLYDGKQRPARLRSLLLTYARDTGLYRGTREVERTDKGDMPQLHAFGEALLVRRSQRLEILR